MYNAVAFCRHRVPWAALVGWIALLVGCGPSGPKTYPVSGKVVTAKADNLKQLVGQAVEFQSTTEPYTRGFGEIQPDGSFTLSTYRQGASLRGAIEGTHKVRLMIGLGEDDEDQPRRKRWNLDPKYTNFEKSGWEVTVPTTGEVLLKLP
ncbi:MAG: hypothetical protein L0Z62_24740 [Gemmataceae bacterium]|nr:hypothetical protein [Gemmataceae bacterium]